MKTSEFNTLKTIIQESGCVAKASQEKPALDNILLDAQMVKDLLTDGENIIDLYIQYMVVMGKTMTSESFNEMKFWEACESVLVDERDLPKGADEEG